MNEDAEHLSLLGIFHYVVAGMAALFACIPFIHLFIGIAMLSGAFDGSSTPQDFPGRLFGLFFIVLAGVFILAGWSFAVCVFLGGRYLRKRTHYTYCLVMGGVECMFVPFGTVLGVFTILVLQRPTVKRLFGRAEPATAKPQGS